MLPKRFRREGKPAGRAVLDRKTKHLVKRIRPGEVAVIDHQDLDELAAEAMVEKRVKAVINAADSFTGWYPAAGSRRLLEAGIPLLDRVGPCIFEKVKEGMHIVLDEDTLWLEDSGDQRMVAKGRRFTREVCQRKMEEGRANLEDSLKGFIANTLSYASKEQSLVTSSLPVPSLRTRMKGRHVVAVVRGTNYKKDLKAIRSYIREVRPVLLAVDGGADALIQIGLQPDIILGDMDSVSDRALKSGAELIVHAYPDGIAPGRERLERLGIAPYVIPSVGTSEDVAMLMAFQEGADLIVTVGSHSNMVDFLEKGRKGMASTLLVRMKIGSKLVDAKGVNRLYRSRVRWKELSVVGLASVFPACALLAVDPDLLHGMKLLWLQLKLIWT
ncbi:putative cytokinetic ring protein SteA [Paludifilum halophilum]|uniref:Thiamin pyrophosphokinase n=1 Tax=Paludifilum halophilum TaxID=1642702 RepID=A0A235BCH6_9BACL|nr:putative cytokinetic ring protein SteA [Paludifilum halophilum]OYD09986.1 thiamin pyrophosphokinase [Paludifilum halophilum]